MQRRQPSFDLAELVGRKTEDVRERCARDGFQVQVIDLDRHPWVTLELNPHRIRLSTRRGVVEECHQG
ncbi:hypothetical protein [Amycolatopsis sp. MtRt-6]|uniref:hypothetical protein n=1 Tax=Amycolatopsis sp. MtRt-6 TaxID=2792782 RepID=UPI001F5D35A7|nr:hypothetical protein [Amycolatopsis sp. MtRt-6]